MKSPGFTMVEVVVAIALSTAIVVSVYSVTVSSKALAQRQATVRAEDIQRRRFIAMLRRDCRGWLAYGNSGAATAPDNEKKVLLSFATSADAVTPGNDPTGNMMQPRCAVVQYFARQTIGGYEIVRSETGSHGTTELPLLSLKEMPRAEFHDGRNWSETRRDAKLRPSALRVASGGSVIVSIGL